MQLRNSLCGAELLSPTREAVARSAKAPGEINSPDAPQRQVMIPSPICALQRTQEASHARPALQSASRSRQREYRCPKGNIVFAKGKNIIQAAGLNIVIPHMPCPLYRRARLKPRSAKFHVAQPRRMLYILHSKREVTYCVFFIRA